MRFQILPTGRVVGKVVAGTLEILAAAFYQGELSMHPEEGKEMKGEARTTSVLAPAVLDSLLSPAAPPVSTARRVVEAGRTNDVIGE